MDSYIYIIDDLAFFLTGILFLYFLYYPPLHISDISHTLKLKKNIAAPSLFVKAVPFPIYMGKNHPTNSSHTTIYIKVSSV